MALSLISGRSGGAKLGEVIRAEAGVMAIRPRVSSNEANGVSMSPPSLIAGVIYTSIGAISCDRVGGLGRGARQETMVTLRLIFFSVHKRGAGRVTG